MLLNVFAHLINDDRTMDEAGIQPRQITEDINNVCDELEKLISMYASRN